MSSKKLSTAIVCILLFSFIPVIPHQVAFTNSVTFPEPITTYATAGEVITITSDSHFAVVAVDFGFPGDGTETNPYVIADLDIDYIRIDDTTVHFEIRRCYLSPTDDSRSIDLDTVENGLIDSCEIIERPNGIKVRSSTNVTISNNILHTLTVESISVDLCTNCVVVNNTIEFGGFGIGSQDSSELVIENNLVEECRDGIYLSDPQYTNITSNEVIGGTTGLTILGCFFLTANQNIFWDTGIHISDPTFSMSFSNNTINGKELGVMIVQLDIIIDASLYGYLLLYQCSNVTIANGSFSSQSHCIEMYSCTQCVIENITFFDVSHGIWIVQSTKCIITDSSFTTTSYPIFSSDCDDLRILESTIASDGAPVVLLESKNSTIVNNTFTDSYITFKPWLDPYSFGSTFIYYFTHDIRNNTINGLPLGYFLNQSNETFSLEDYGQMIIVNSTDLSLGPSLVIDRGFQLHIYHSDEIHITECTFTSEDTSVLHLIESDNCSINDCVGTRTDVFLYNSKRFNFMRNLLQSETDSGFVFSRGAYMYNCDDSIISENTLLGPFMEGMLILSSDNITVSKNDLDQPYFGLVIGASNSRVEENHISSSQNNALSLTYSTNTTVTSNICDKSETTSFRTGYNGIYIGHCTNCTIIDNLVIDGDGTGIRLSDSLVCTIESNIVQNNWDDGIYVSYSHNCSIIDNTIVQNGDYGIRVSQLSSNNSFYLNRLGFNPDSNARDDGFNSTWDNGVDTGNYWQDYSGSGVYEIEGTAGSVDRYPMYMMIDDGVQPIINHPENISYEYGTTNHRILWQATDDYPHIYRIELNGTIIESGAWETYWFSVDVDGLDLGIYNYTLIVFDEGGLWVSDSVFVNVIPQSNPTTGFTLSLVLIAIGGGCVVTVVIVIYWLRFKRPS